MNNIMTSHAIRRLKEDGSIDTSTLMRVARVWGVLQFMDVNRHGNCEGFGVKNTREVLPVPDGWVGVS